MFYAQQTDDPSNADRRHVWLKLLNPVDMLSRGIDTSYSTLSAMMMGRGPLSSVFGDLGQVFSAVWDGTPVPKVGPRADLQTEYDILIQRKERYDRLRFVFSIVASFPGSRRFFRQVPSQAYPSKKPRNQGSVRWFFVNGICTTLDIALANREALEAFCGEPVELWYNATDGFVLDIAECIARTYKAIHDPDLRHAWLPFSENILSRPKLWSYYKQPS